MQVPRREAWMPQTFSNLRLREAKSNALAQRQWTNIENPLKRTELLKDVFKKVIVEPTSYDETLQILHNIKDRYEDHHNVRYTEEALEACVSLTDRYISDRCQPDKAIDALDESGSHAHIVNLKVPKELEECETK